MSQREPCPKPSSHLIGCLGCPSLQGGGPKGYPLTLQGEEPRLNSVVTRLHPELPWGSPGPGPQPHPGPWEGTPHPRLFPRDKGQVFTVLSILHARLEAGLTRPPREAS